MKKIAFYLPQYHSIPENDSWWGEGFTEWDNVKKSKPQFKDHSQPEVPLGNNYYCLLERSVQEQQANLALKYGIDGFCYYHYWFEGKLLLEKPAEQMLSNKKIKLEFCFCWANESWARTWDGQEKQILIKQNYNENEEAWKKHFDYLLPFFKDERYIKVDNKPLFILYKPHLIKNVDEFRAYWNKLAESQGFSGIYWAFQHDSAFDHVSEMNSFDMAIEFEPFYTVRKMPNRGKQPLIKRVIKKIRNMPTIYSYDEVWSYIINRKPELPISAPGVFTSWDNTPRRGNNAIVFWKATPEKFKNYLQKKITNLNKYNSQFIFINAWNEWAEGAHLEPDEKNGYGYLEAVKSAFEDSGESENEDIS